MAHHPMRNITLFAPERYVMLEPCLSLNRTASTGLSVTPRNNAMRRIRSGCCIHRLKKLCGEPLD